MGLVYLCTWSNMGAQLYFFDLVSLSWRHYLLNHLFLFVYLIMSSWLYIKFPNSFVFFFSPWAAPEPELKYFFNIMVLDYVSICQGKSSGFTFLLQNKLKYFLTFVLLFKFWRQLVAFLKSSAAIMIGILLNIFIYLLGDTHAFPLLVFLSMNIVYFCLFWHSLNFLSVVETIWMVYLSKPR